MPPTPAQTEKGYFALWNRATVRPQEAAAVRAVAHKIIANKHIYKKVEDATGVPWFMIGPIHNRESSLRFDAHLHCGTTLKKRTTLVPKNRPSKGNPPFAWDVSAIDALSVPPHDLAKVKNWSVERILYETEKYNGWGYLGKVNSPYLWAGTTEYSGGKYTRDHFFDPKAWDKQLGCVAILKTLADMDADVKRRLLNRQVAPPSDIDPQDRYQAEAIRNAQNTRNGAAGGAVVGAGAEGTMQATKPPTAGVGTGIIFPVFIAIAIAVVIGAIIVIARKKAQAAADANQAWTGEVAK